MSLNAEPFVHINFVKIVDVNEPVKQIQPHLDFPLKKPVQSAPSSDLKIKKEILYRIQTGKVPYPNNLHFK